MGEIEREGEQERERERQKREERDRIVIVCVDVGFDGERNSLSHRDHPPARMEHADIPVYFCHDFNDIVWTIERRPVFLFLDACGSVHKSPVVEKRVEDLHIRTDFGRCKPHTKWQPADARVLKKWKQNMTENSFGVILKKANRQALTAGTYTAYKNRLTSFPAHESLGHASMARSTGAASTPQPAGLAV